MATVEQVTLSEVAHWFAREIAGNELGAYPPPDKRHEDEWGIRLLPELFQDSVAEWMVMDKDLGWPNLAEAKDSLKDMYGWFS